MYKKKHIDITYSNLDKILMENGIPYTQIENMSNSEKLLLSLKVRKANNSIKNICDKHKKL